MRSQLQRWSPYLALIAFVLVGLGVIGAKSYELYRDVSWSELRGAVQAAWHDRNVPTADDLRKMSEESMARNKPASWSNADYHLATCMLAKIRETKPDFRQEIICDMMLKERGITLVVTDQS